MTDLEKLQSLLTEFGVEFNLLTAPGNEISASIDCQANVHTKVVGYAGFSVDFNFDKDGKFIEIGVWE